MAGLEVNVPRFAVMEQVLRSGDVATDLAWASQAGATGIGLDVPTFGNLDVGTIRAMLEAKDLRISSVDRLSPLTLRAQRDDLEAERTIARWAGAGASNLLVNLGPRGDRSFADADAEVQEALGRLSPIAVTHNVRLLVEPIHPLASHLTYVHTLRHAAELIAPYPGAGIVLDVAHVYWDRHFYDDLETAADLICTVQVSDVDQDALTDYVYRRCQLGEGIVPLEDMLMAIDAAGYHGFYEFESVRRLPKDDRTQYVIRAREWLTRLWSAGHQADD